MLVLVLCGPHLMSRMSNEGVVYDNFITAWAVQECIAVPEACH